MNDQERFEFFARRQVSYKPKEEIVTFNNGLFKLQSEPIDVNQWMRRMQYGAEGDCCENQE
jgi:hypothetical protein